MAIDSQHFEGTRRLTKLEQMNGEIPLPCVRWVVGNLAENVITKASKWASTVDMEGRDDVVVVVSTTVEVFDRESYDEMYGSTQERA